MRESPRQLACNQARYLRRLAHCGKLAAEGVEPVPTEQRAGTDDVEPSLPAAPA